MKLASLDALWGMAPFIIFFACGCCRAVDDAGAAPVAAGQQQTASAATTRTATTLAAQSRPATAPAALAPMKQPRIVVEKSARRLTLYDGQKVVKVFRACSGTIPGDKEREGDRKTPLGDFFVCYKNPTSKYTRSLGLTYPNPEDARRGREGDEPLISQEQHDRIVGSYEQTLAFFAAHDAPEVRKDGIVTVPGVDWETLWKTPLGGEIMIHGAGADRAGTAGCVGMDDRDILPFFEAIPLGTPVKILP